MVLTRAQAKALQTELVYADSPDSFARKVKAEAEAKRVSDSKTAEQLDALADMFSSSVSVGKTPEQALAEAMAGLGIGGRRKTRRARGGRAASKKTRAASVKRSSSKKTRKA